MCNLFLSCLIIEFSLGLISSTSSIHPLLIKFVETKVFISPPPMLEEDIQLRAFQSLKVDRNHMKLNLNQLSSLNKFESVRKQAKNSKKEIYLFI